MDNLPKKQWRNQQNDCKKYESQSITYIVQKSKKSTHTSKQTIVHDGYENTIQNATRDQGKIAELNFFIPKEKNNNINIVKKSVTPKVISYKNIM